MPSSFNRCSALAGREPSRVTIRGFESVFTFVSIGRFKTVLRRFASANLS